MLLNTAGPGLLGALLIGENFAQGLALSLNKPLIPVNHLEAHVLTSRFATSTSCEVPKVEFPYLSVLVTGKHTQIVLTRGVGMHTIMGMTKDNAVG